MTSAVYPTARLAIWPGRQYTNLLFFSQASYIVIVVSAMELREPTAYSAVLISKFE